MQVRAKAVELGELEERYWHDFNDFQIQLRAHVDERDVLLRKVCGVLLGHCDCHAMRARFLLVHQEAMHAAAVTQLSILNAAPICCLGSSLLIGACIMSHPPNHLPRFIFCISACCGGLLPPAHLWLCAD